MKELKKLQTELMVFLLLAVGLFYQVSGSFKFIHPETIERYPQYLAEPSVGNCWASAFDACTGEACVKDRMYSWVRCEDDQHCESRSRNLNYYVDCLDGVWIKSTNFQAGIISHFVTYFLSFVFLLMGFWYRSPFISANEVSKFKRLLYAIIFAILPLLFHAYATNLDVVYRSGKLLTLSLLAYLFMFYQKAERESTISKTWLFATFIFTSIFALADEMAVAIIFFTILFHGERFLRKKSTSDMQAVVALGAGFIFYLIFRLFAERMLTPIFSGIEIKPTTGSYGDIESFFQFDTDMLLKVLEAYWAQLVFTVGAHTNYGESVIYTFFAVVFLAFMASRFFKSKNIRIIHVGALLGWTLFTYLLALRHPPIIAPPAYGGGYYFAVFILLVYLVFIRMGLMSLPKLQYKWLLWGVILFCGMSHSINFTSKQEEIFSIMSGPRWYQFNNLLIRWIQAEGDLPNLSAEEQQTIMYHKKFTDKFHK